MVKRWRDEIVLGMVLLGCSACGGFLGAKMAQIDVPKASATYDSSETFGTLPPPPDSVPMGFQGHPPVLVIVVNHSNTSERQSRPAVDLPPESLKSIQGPVNFI